MHWLVALVAVWIAAPPPGSVAALVQHQGVLRAGGEAGLFTAGTTGWQPERLRGSVLDAALAQDTLWLATAHGLWAWPANGEARLVPLGAGARLRGIAADSAGQVWVATEAGLFVRRSGTEVFERDTTLPPGEVLAVRAVEAKVFAARSGALWARRGERFESLATGLGEGWWELRGAAVSGGSVYLAVPRGLWRFEGAAEQRIEPGLGELRDVHAAESGLWVASSRGLWRFDPAPRGSGGVLPQVLLDAPVWKLCADGDRVLAATDRGIAALPAAPSELSSPPPALHAGRIPDVRAVQVAALEYLDLGPGELRSAGERARRRGWWPLVRARVMAARGGSRDHDRDEVLSSGAVWNLSDWAHERERNTATDLELVWDLGQLAAPDDAIAISRERRLVIELRDQVLERVSRLYFEHVRARDELAAADEAADRRELELRVGELGARLDAWTGGRFSRLTGDSPRIDGRQP